MVTRRAIGATDPTSSAGAGAGLIKVKGGRHWCDGRGNITVISTMAAVRLKGYDMEPIRFQSKVCRVVANYRSSHSRPCVVVFGEVPHPGLFVFFRGGETWRLISNVYFN